jgi:hypothetical protein
MENNTLTKERITQLLGILDELKNEAEKEENHTQVGFYQDVEQLLHEKSQDN